MRRRDALVLTVVAGLAVFGSGCSSLWQEARFQRDVELTFLLPPGAGLEATSENGSVTLTEVARDDVLVRARIRATTQERADAVQIVADAASGAFLQVGASWPTSRTGSEGVSFEIEAPGNRQVRAQTSNGRIEVSGFAGGADLTTSNGAIEVRGHTGPVNARTSNGAVTIVGATDSVRVGTSNGAIRVELADGSSGPVDLDTSNGGVALVVGSGFSGEIDAHTSNGKVHTTDATGAGRVEVLGGGSTSKRVRIGGEGALSTIRTSNGSVGITSRK